MKKNDGGPAYPIVCNSDPVLILHSSGMSLRDYFASHAPEMEEQFFKDSPKKEHITATISVWNYIYADAMIKERDKENG